MTAREGVLLAEPEQAEALERRLENLGRYIRACDYRGCGHRQARLLAYHGSEEDRATQEHSGRHDDRLHQAIAKVATNNAHAVASTSSPAAVAVALAVADGALGFCSAARRCSRPTPARASSMRPLSPQSGMIVRIERHA